MTTKKNFDELKKQVYQNKSDSDRTRILVEGVDGENGLSSKIIELKEGDRMMKKDIDNLGNAFRQLNYKLNILITIVVSVGLADGLGLKEIIKKYLGV